MNWYDRAQDRYVEYGSSFRASQRFGFSAQLTDTVYNLNGAHLAADTPTLFEVLDDAEVATAGTTYLIYRGRHRHEPRRDGLLTRIASPFARYPVMGPKELFYADIFASQPAPCNSLLGMPGIRDRHSACVSAYLLERDLADFLLLSFPDNDWYSHKHGPDSQVQSLARADEQLARVADAAGGVDAMIDSYAVVVLGDHSQAPVTAAVDLLGALGEIGVAAPRHKPHAETAAIAVCPSQRAAMVYVLDEGSREATRAAVVAASLATTGVALVCWMQAGRDTGAVAVLASPAGGRLRFAPGGTLRDRRGGEWTAEGDLEAFGLAVDAGVIDSPLYPDALGRIWSALGCRHAGDVLLSAAPGYEFADWGGQAHPGGGSHGALDAQDSLTGLIMCGLPASVRPDWQWTLRDVAPLVAKHFGVQVPGTQVPPRRR
jgi:hypothetical protein